MAGARVEPSEKVMLLLMARRPWTISPWRGVEITFKIDMRIYKPSAFGLCFNFRCLLPAFLSLYAWGNAKKKRKNVFTHYHCSPSTFAWVKEETPLSLLNLLWYLYKFYFIWKWEQTFFALFLLPEFIFTFVFSYTPPPVHILFILTLSECLIKF